jgi:hypothetical protein
LSWYRHFAVEKCKRALLVLLLDVQSEHVEFIKHKSRQNTPESIRRGTLEERVEQGYLALDEISTIVELAGGGAAASHAE